MRLATFLLAVLLLVPKAMLAQSIPILPRGLTPTPPAPPAPVSAPVVGTVPGGEPAAPPPPPNESAGRGRPAWLFPLIDKGKDATKDFYGQASQITPLSQVRFLQALGVASRLLSADLTSVLFPGGFRVAVGTSVAAANVDDNKNDNSAEEQKERALNRLNGGGDIFLNVAMPAIATQRTYGSFYTFVLPKFGFTFPGFSSGTSPLEATETYVDVSGESYGEYRAFSDEARVFGDIKWGYLHVPDTFAATIGLREASTTDPRGNIVLGAVKPSTLLAQLSLGIEFSGFLRISAQRFVGTNADTFGPPESASSNWRISIQMAPKKP